MSYVISTDVGGTCTDTVIVERGKSIIIGKALSTPPNFAQGVIDSIQSAADVLQTIQAWAQVFTMHSYVIILVLYLLHDERQWKFWYWPVNIKTASKSLKIANISPIA